MGDGSLGDGGHDDASAQRQAACPNPAVTPQAPNAPLLAATGEQPLTIPLPPPAPLPAPARAVG